MASQADMAQVIAELRRRNMTPQPAQNYGAPTMGGTQGPRGSAPIGMQDYGQNGQPQQSAGSGVLDGLKAYNNASNGGLNRALFGQNMGAAGQGMMNAANQGAAQVGSQFAPGLAGQAGGVSFPGAPAAGGAGGAAGGGMMGGAGGVMGLAALSHLFDREMNENKGSMINADKLNKMGSIKGIGLRGGDLMNGFNPATWMSDPKKAAKGLGNAFTFGLMDKLF